MPTAGTASHRVLIHLFSQHREFRNRATMEFMVVQRLVLAALLLITLSAQAQHATPTVTIATGRIEGVAVPTLPIGGAFLGIPYAAQPVGDFRWRPPQPASAWTGVLHAKAFSPACPQAPSGWLPEMLGETQMRTDEACLFLNVWTPHLRPNAHLPVLVWIHGGGNVEGSAEWPPLGETFAARGIVVVSINYRLGIFGFYATPQLSAESPDHRSGNYGQLDQLAALAWVQKNIAHFGGDPHRVTVAGQSSGALDICNLIASPLATHLFQRAILESGVCVDSVFPTSQEIEAANAHFGDHLGPTNAAASLTQLRALPAQQLLNAAAHDDNLDLEPAVDGRFLLEQPALTFASGRQLPLPILTGSTENEVSIFASPIVGGTSHRPQTLAAYHQFLDKKFGPLAPKVFAAYPATTDAEVPRVFTTMFSDFDFGYSARLLATETARIHQPAYLYHFTYVGQGPFAALGAFHAEELMFLSQHDWSSWVRTPDDAHVSAALLGYWVRFIQTGNPNRPGLPAWPAYTPQFDLTQILGSTVTTERDPRSEQFAPFQEYLDSRLARLPSQGAAIADKNPSPK
jgi:para-nitrobenzyl esterase